jgi:hypothetical protein
MPIAAASLSDGRVQVWRAPNVPGWGPVVSSWQTRIGDPTSFTPWVGADEENLGGQVLDVAAKLIGGSNARTHVWAANGNPPGLNYAYKASSNPDDRWIPGGSFLRAIGLFGVPVYWVAASRRVWLAAGEGRNSLPGIWGTQKTDPGNPSSSWRPAQKLREPGGGTSAVGEEGAVGTLADGREQLWIFPHVVVPRHVVTTWEVGSHGSGSWVPMQQWGIPGNQPALDVAVAPLAGGRLQVWVATRGALYTTWKVGGPDSEWTPWQDFLEEVPLPSGHGGWLESIAAIPVGSGRQMMVWAVGSGPVLNTWKVNSDPNAPWAPWQSVG